MRRQSQLRQCEVKSRCLVHSGGKHHHCAFVENDLQLQTKIADDLQRGHFVRFPGRDDDPPFRLSVAPNVLGRGSASIVSSRVAGQ